jgi:hypothetical protein
VAKGKRPISFWPIAQVVQVPPVATYVSPSMGGEAPVTLNTPAYGARFKINGTSIPCDAGLDSAQNVCDIINATVPTQVFAFINADGSIEINAVAGQAAPVFSGDATLLTALGLT